MDKIDLNYLKNLEINAKEEILKANTSDELESISLKYIGRKGSITKILRSLSELPLDERKEIGSHANIINMELKGLIETRKKELLQKEQKEKLLKEKIDITLPSVKIEYCHGHPLTETMYEICEIFMSLGFQVVLGPEIETDYYNFKALNMPENHPARSMWDTLYINFKSKESGQLLLRTHTSPVQIRTMEKMKPPVRVIIPGRVYRHEAIDSSHLPMFFQIEGLAVDKDITFADLKGILVTFVRKMFGQNAKTRFRPSYFPFTEPSAEMDMMCSICNGQGCTVCSQTGWLEMLGCGMVHPNVLRNVKYDIDIYSGFAFGLGVDRFAMLKYGINDIRMLYENDLRILKQI